jgi:hypothetical protein
VSFSWIYNSDKKWPEIQTTAEVVSIKIGQSAMNADCLFEETAAEIVQSVQQLSYGLDDLGFQSLHMGFFPSPKCQDWLRCPQNFLLSGYWHSLRGKMAGCEVDRSTPPNAEVKNEWCYTSAPSVAFITWTGIM